MNITTFVFNVLGVNSYLLWSDETREACLIDCAMQHTHDQRQFADFMQEHGLTLTMALQTHTHFDHIFGIPYLERRYGITPRCHKAEMTIYNNRAKWFAMAGIHATEEYPPLTQFVEDGETLTFDGSAIQVLHTPGHTPGGVCYYLPTECCVFTGDTLFCGSMGRYDLPGGDYEQEMASIRNVLLTLPAATKVYPGHGPTTTIGQEMMNF
ncbi:MAG: MBL fold metallo-hydrolase [Bacteroidaceae bacterium]|nr:MBL fold metallo-hydrolase [Bacteroidaceae bacterium]